MLVVYDRRLGRLGETHRPTRVRMLGIAVWAIVGNASAFAARPSGSTSPTTAAVEKLNPKTGGVKVVSDDRGSAPRAGSRSGRADKLLVSTYASGSRPILKVNPDNGNVGTVTDSDKFVSPFDLAQDAQRPDLRRGRERRAERNGEVFRVTADSGRAKTIVEGPAARQPVWPRAGPPPQARADFWPTTGVTVRERSSASTSRPALSRRSPAGRRWSIRPVGEGPGRQAIRDRLQRRAW